MVCTDRTKRKMDFIYTKITIFKKFSCPFFVRYTLVLIVHNSASHEQKNTELLLPTMQGEDPIGCDE